MKKPMLGLLIVVRGTPLFARDSTLHNWVWLDLLPEYSSARKRNRFHIENKQVFNLHGTSQKEPGCEAMRNLFQQFARDRRYLKRVSATTEKWYWQSWNASTSVLSDTIPDELNKNDSFNRIGEMRTRAEAHNPMRPFSARKRGSALRPASVGSTAMKLRSTVRCDQACSKASKARGFSPERRRHGQVARQGHRPTGFP
jgi:hypothetical protein